jgi:hypothetical protein
MLKYLKYLKKRTQQIGIPAIPNENVCSSAADPSWQPTFHLQCLHCTTFLGELLGKVLQDL